MDIDTKQALYEQEKVSELIGMPGARIIAEKLKRLADETERKQLDYDPYTEPEKIMRAKQFRYVVNTLLPEIIEGIVNYDPDAPDMQAAPANKWRLWEWLKALIGRKVSN